MERQTTGENASRPATAINGSGDGAATQPPADGRHVDITFFAQDEKAELGIEAMAIIGLGVDRFAELEYT